MQQDAKISHLYLSYFAFVMAGYMALDKGFAYIGLKPLFIGEISLALGMGVMMLGGWSSRVLHSPLAWAIFVFMIWNALRTLPYVDQYGLDTLRDAVLWGYALFAYVIGGILIKNNKIEAVPNLYGRIFPITVLVGAAGLLVTEILYTSLPKWPGTDASLIMVKASDLGAHTAGALAFMALGLHQVFPRKKKFRLPLQEIMMWGILALSTALVLSRARGGFVAIACAGLLVTLFRPMNRMMKMVAPALAFIALFFVLNIEIPLGGGRVFSGEQLMTNVLSLVSEQDKDVLDETEEWRLTWWASIIDDTIYGEKFWLGRGYGISHSEVDGFADHSGNRSPHNVHMNLLGRGGVPGLLLWIGVLLTFYVVMLQCYFRAERDGKRELAAINLWLMAYVLGIMVASSFDNFLEGPQGGIPFWTIMGFAIALAEAQRPTPVAPMPAPATPPPPPPASKRAAGPARARPGGRSGGFDRLKPPGGIRAPIRTRGYR